MAINKEAIIDAVFQGAGAPPPRTRSRRPCGPTTTPSRTIPTIRKRPRRCWRSRRLRPVDEGLGDAGGASLQPERPPHGRTDPGRLRRGRRRRRDRLLRVGRVSRPLQGVDRDGAVLLGWTGDNGDPDNFLACCSAATRSAAPTAPSGATRSSTKLVKKAKVTSDQAERTKLYEEAQVVFKRRRRGRRSTTRWSSCRCARKSRASSRARSATSPSTASTSPKSNRAGIAGGCRPRAPRPFPMLPGIILRTLSPGRLRPDPDLHRGHDRRLRLHPPAAGRSRAAAGGRARHVARAPRRD
jgi:hypothetical protein